MTSLNENKFLIKMMGTDPTKKEDMQPKEVLSYSIAGLGQNIICQLVTTFFMVYMTDVAGVSALWLAWMFLGARLFDAFNDPIMGSIVEMTRTKAGKMRPYLKYSPIPIAILRCFCSFRSPGGRKRVNSHIPRSSIYCGVSLTLRSTCRIGDLPLR